MAKKKVVSPEKEVEDDFEDILEEEEIEIVYPKVEKKRKKKEDKSIDSSPEAIGDGDIDEEEDLPEEEEEPRFTEYKYLDLNINKTLVGENDYELYVEGQSHGFCNIFVKHLLEIEGVTIAAYKITGIEPPKIFIRLENSKDYKIKDILYKGIESLREEVVKVQNLFNKLI